MTIQATIYLTAFDNTTDNWHAAYAASVERHLDDAGLVYDGHAGDVRQWREGDDEDTAVEAIAFYVRPPHEAPKGSVLDVWTSDGNTLHLRGADLEAALLDAYNAAQKVADDSTRVEVELETANGPRVTFPATMHPDEVEAELPAGWRVHEDDWSLVVDIGGGRRAAPLTKA